MRRLSGRSRLWLGLVATLLAGKEYAAAQSASQSAVPKVIPAGVPPDLGRLDVRLPAMASGTQTARAGQYDLDSLSGGDSLVSKTYIYVPRRSVGTKRVPLLVLLHGSGGSGLDILNDADGMFQKFADTTGVILLAPTSRSSDGGWGNLRDTKPRNVDVPRLSAALRLVLSHYAIDPARIALIGTSAGAGAALDYGLVNGDVFSRAIAFAGWEPFYNDNEFDSLPRYGKPAVFFGMNSDESDQLFIPNFVSWLNEAGYTATNVEDSGGHQLNEGRAAAGLKWLVESWK